MDKPSSGQQPQATITESAVLPTEWGEFTLFGFADSAYGEEKNNSPANKSASNNHRAEREHVALVMGDLAASPPPLCRIHSECLTGDALFSLRCDCGPQLRAAMQAMGKEGRGLILYLRQEGRGIGLHNKIRAYALQDSGADTVEANVKLGFQADNREYWVCKPMLDFLNLRRVRLMTNNPHKVKAMKTMGISISEVVPLHTGSNPHNESYLATKIAKLGHLQ